MGPGPARDAVLTAYARMLINKKARQLCRKPGFSRSDQEDPAELRLVGRIAGRERPSQHLVVGGARPLLGAGECLRC